jgi:hypothetical protein
MEKTMNDGWLVLGFCLIFVLGAALPLINSRRTDNTPLPPPKETLRDWRGEEEK